ncbi:MAG: hypothetical protein ACJ8AY_02045 [Gemmatimonadales bacterium]
MTGEINGFLVIGALWFVLTLITRAKGSARPRQPGPSSYPRPTPLPSQPDPTQQEGFRLQMVLGDLRRALEEAAQAASPSGAPAAERKPRRRIESLEPEIRNLEGEGEREAVDFDDEAAGIEARRIQAAVERDEGRKSGAKQAAAKVRQEPADNTRTPGYSARQLRDAVVWREILGPPLALRNERED